MHLIDSHHTCFDPLNGTGLPPDPNPQTQNTDLHNRHSSSVWMLDRRAHVHLCVDPKPHVRGHTAANLNFFTQVRERADLSAAYTSQPSMDYEQLEEGHKGGSTVRLARL